MKMTKTTLAAKVNILNGLTEGTYFCLDYAYGGVRLCKKSNNHGGLTDISEHMTMREMGLVLDSIINALYHIK